jgi:hypothetical protein
VIRILLCLVLLSACNGQDHSESATSEARSPSTLSDAEKVQEVVIRNLIFDCMPKQKAEEQYFLSVGENSDVSRALLAHLEFHVPNVKPESAAELPPASTEHRNQWRDGVFVHVSEPSWLSTTQVELQGGWSRGPLWARGYRYRLMLEDTGWVIASKIGTSVS